MTWMKTVQNDLDSHGLSWTDAVDLVQNRPLWRLLATSGATHSQWFKPEKKRRQEQIWPDALFGATNDSFGYRRELNPGFLGASPPS